MILKTLLQSICASNLAESFEPISIPSGTIYYENERLIVKHDDKPSAEVIAKIKKRGFKFSPKSKSWVRQFTHNAVMSAKILAEELGNIVTKGTP